MHLMFKRDCFLYCEHLKLQCVELWGSKWEIRKSHLASGYFHNTAFLQATVCFIVSKGFVFIPTTTQPHPSESFQKSKVFENSGAVWTGGNNEAKQMPSANAANNIIMFYLNFHCCLEKHKQWFAFKTGCSSAISIICNFKHVQIFSYFFLKTFWETRIKRARPGEN